MTSVQRFSRGDLGWRLRRRFGWVVARAEIAAAIREPHRLLGTALYALTAVLAATYLTVQWGIQEPAELIWGTLGVAAAGFASLVVVITVGLAICESISCGWSDRVWILELQHGAAVALAAAAGDYWEVRSVAAWPMRRGSGRHLMQAVVADADQAGVSVVLRAATGVTADRFYGRLGFRRVGRRWSGIDMSRDPVSRPVTL